MLDSLLEKRSLLNIPYRIVRDQANKTIDIFIARIRKYAISLPDTVLPPPSTAPSTANGTSGTSTPRMGTPQADAAGWAGWAISSFTSKLGAASGEIEARPTKNVVSSKNPRASSVPPSADTSLPVRTSTSSASNLHRQALNAASTSTPLVITADDEDVDDGWGAFDDTNDDANAEADSFFDAPSQAESSVTSPTVTSPNPFDDAGEPDFAGWLAAQSKSKVKAPLAKGLSKTTTTAAKAAVVRTSNTSAVKKAAAPTMSSAAVAVKSTTMTKTAEKKELEKAKVIDTKPKDDVGDDWGDAWD
jgi:SCY1-like protein 1